MSLITLTSKRKVIFSFAVPFFLFSSVLFQSCEKEGSKLNEDEFIVTYLDEKSKCSGELVEYREEDRERISKFSRNTVSSEKIGVLNFTGKYIKGKQIIIKVRKPDDNIYCTTEVLAYGAVYLIEVLD